MQIHAGPCCFCSQDYIALPETALGLSQLSTQAAGGPGQESVGLPGVPAGLPPPPPLPLGGAKAAATMAAPPQPSATSQAIPPPPPLPLGLNMQSALSQAAAIASRLTSGHTGAEGQGSGPPAPPSTQQAGQWAQPPSSTAQHAQGRAPPPQDSKAMAASFMSSLAGLLSHEPAPPPEPLWPPPPPRPSALAGQGAGAVAGWVMGAREDGRAGAGAGAGVGEEAGAGVGVTQQGEDASLGFGMGLGTGSTDFPSMHRDLDIFKAIFETDKVRLTCHAVNLNKRICTFTNLFLCVLGGCCLSWHFLIVQ